MAPRLIQALASLAWATPSPPPWHLLIPLLSCSHLFSKEQAEWSFAHENQIISLPR